MADPVSVVVNPIVKLVIKHAVSLIEQRYHMIQGLEDDIESLSSHLSTIQSVLEDAEEKQQNSRQVKVWLEKLQEASLDAEDLLEGFRTDACMWEMKSKVLYLKILDKEKAAYAKNIKKLLKRIVDIAKEKEILHLDLKDSSSSHDIRSRTTSSHVNVSDVFGRDDEKNQIIDLLLSEEVDRVIVPIIGLGGVGKTTLAQLVYNDDRVKSHFQEVGALMWVCVTKNFDYKKILKEMIESHSTMNKYDVNSLSDAQMESRLLELLHEKNFLLVLDDVWVESYQEWEPLKNILERAGKGCRVLVTSRSIRVAEVMGAHPHYPLDILPTEHCWSLFKKMVLSQTTLDGHVWRELEEIGKGIVDKCKGLPLAVKAMGGILLGNYNVRHWRRILSHEIWEAEEQKVTTGKPIVLPALRLSYDHLPSHLKFCFQHCSIFPKAYVFRKMELIKIWKASSLIQPRRGDAADEIGSDYFDDLLARSFFQLIEDGTYRMHDLIQDLAQSLSRSHYYQVKDNGPLDLSNTSRHVTLLGKDVEQAVLHVAVNCKKLRTLLVPTGYMKDYGDALDELLLACEHIRVLDLSSSSLRDLPKSIENLKLLRYLDLSKTEIQQLPESICTLYNLETLKLLGCLWLSELPKDLGNLSNLQHLELEEIFWHKLSTLPPRIGDIPCLQNLHAFNVSNERRCGIDELGNMKHLTGRLHIFKLENAVNARAARLTEKEGLTEVVLEWSTDLSSLEEVYEKTLEDLQVHSNVERLQIFHYMGNRLPSWLSNGQLVQNLRSISLKHCRKLKTLLLGQFPHLHEVNLKGLPELEAWQEAEYSSLRMLKISNCPNLRELPCYFSNLTVLKIKRCNSLKALPLTPCLSFLVLSENLILEYWVNGISIGVPVDDQSPVVEIYLPSYINLRELTIRNCPQVSRLPFFAPQKLEVSGCPLLTTLPSPEVSRRLHHLALDACHDGLLLRTIPATTSLCSLVISKISNLTSLPKWPPLPELKALYISQCEELVSLVDDEESFIGLSSLQLLSIRSCHKLVTLPAKGFPKALKSLTFGCCTSLESLGPTEVLKDLNSLTDLYIENCPAIRSLPEQGPPASLKHLLITGCNQLAIQCQKDIGPYWPMINHIADLEIDSPEVPRPPELPKKNRLRTSIFRKASKVGSRTAAQSQKTNRTQPQSSRPSCKLLSRSEPSEPSLHLDFEIPPPNSCLPPKSEISCTNREQSCLEIGPLTFDWTQGFVWSDLIQQFGGNLGSKQGRQDNTRSPSGSPSGGRTPTSSTPPP